MSLVGELGSTLVYRFPIHDWNHLECLRRSPRLKVSEAANALRIASNDHRAFLLLRQGSEGFLLLDRERLPFNLTVKDVLLLFQMLLSSSPEACTPRQQTLRHMLCATRPIAAAPRNVSASED